MVVLLGELLTDEPMTNEEDNKQLLKQFAKQQK